MDRPWIRNNEGTIVHSYQSDYTLATNINGVLSDVVQLSAYNLSGEGLTGSGILIAPDLILTANHVLHGTLALNLDYGDMIPITPIIASPIARDRQSSSGGCRIRWPWLGMRQ